MIDKQFLLTLIWKKMFSVLSWAWDKEKILSPHEESNLRPSDSVLRLHGERGLLQSSYYQYVGKQTGNDDTEK